MNLKPVPVVPVFADFELVFGNSMLRTERTAKANERFAKQSYADESNLKFSHHVQPISVRKYIKYCTKYFNIIKV